MAERRMFAKKVIDSDLFLEMPLSTQALYFHLAMRADDDGFVNNPKKIVRMIGADETALKILISNSFLIPFNTGIVVISHWKLHNFIRKDRYKPTIYQNEKNNLMLQDNGVYEMLYSNCVQEVDKRLTEGIPMVDQWDTQVSIGKVSIGKDNIYMSPKLKKLKFGEFQHVLLTDEEHKKLVEDYGEKIAALYIKKVDEYCEQSGKKYKNYNLAIRNTFMQRDNVKPINQTEAEFYEGLTKDSDGFYVDEDGNRYV